MSPATENTMIKEQHERGVLNRPGGEVAARDGVLGVYGRGHCATSMMRTGIPESSL